MNIRIISSPISKTEALEIGKEFYGDMIKGAVDIEKGVIALGGEYHMDANMTLIKNGSLQKDIWGFNLYPGLGVDEWIDYTALINIRPLAKNRNMAIEDERIRVKIKETIEKLII